MKLRLKIQLLAVVTGGLLVLVMLLGLQRHDTATLGVLQPDLSSVSDRRLA